MWNTLQLSNSKDKFKFTIGEEEVTFSMNDLHTVLKLPQATDNDHAEFVEALELATIIKFLNILGHGVAIRIDQHPLAIMQIFYAIINNVHVYYVALIWEGLHYQLKNPSTKNLAINALGNYKGQCMGITDYLFSEEIMQTEAYKVKIKKRQLDPETPIPTTKKIDIENMTEAQQLSYTLAEKDDSTAIEFVDSLLLSQEDPGTKIDPRSDKERPEAMNIDYVAIVEEGEESFEASLIRKKWKCNLEVRDTPIATSTRSHRINLSLDKENIRKLFVQKSNVKALCMQIDKSPQTAVPNLVAQATNQILKDNLPWIFQDPVQKEHALYISRCMIWERVHNYQLGIASYKIKVSLTAPTLTIPGIETLSLYSIIPDPFVGLVYEISKKEKRVMNIDELQKFCDATLQRVLKNVKEINVEARHGFKDPLLSEKDKELMVLFDEEIEERLNYRRQMRRWESFVNERPIRPLRDRP
ncbi:hypothetical protein Tco_1408042 [Tanacetum coccineum]